MLVLNPAAATAVFALAVTVHNVEEAIWLPAFARSTGARAVGAADVRIVDVVFTLGVYAVSVSAVMWRGPIAVYAPAGIGAAMALNAFVPHLAATIRFRRYAPGTATGLALDLPSGAALISSLPAAGWVSASVLMWAVPVGIIGVGAVTVALLWFVPRVTRRFGG